jgi:hypothetical protein
MIDIKQAVKNALGYVGTIFPAADIIDPRLEEVELSSDERIWLITVSFIRKNVISPSDTSVLAKIKHMQELTGNYSSSDREYKLITIDAETGKPLSMKIRQLV